MLAPNPTLAAAYGGLALLILILTSGFAIVRKSIPVYWIWAYYISPVRIRRAPQRICMYLCTAAYSCYTPTAAVACKGVQARSGLALPPACIMQQNSCIGLYLKLLSTFGLS